MALNLINTLYGIEWDHKVGSDTERRRRSQQNLHPLETWGGKTQGNSSS
ncbi:hypothetical protein [Pseudomonas aeruginosa]|nr:hypothetical protein [Pseudomonas aeruginosa]MBI8222845.1 hypothetical protein [Pseudomonas aeruginosa]MDP5708031.1 hypothetical protein [Pseudomonas aeruginosa]HBO0349213.1 hypothetical protein [Pseudomonas aeruginosa]